MFDQSGRSAYAVHAVGCKAYLPALSRDGPAIAEQVSKRRVKAKLRERRSPAQEPNQVWAMDFAHDQLFDDVCFSYKGTAVIDTLERATRQAGYPKTIHLDNGPEFISRELDL